MVYPQGSPEGSTTSRGARPRTGLGHRLGRDFADASPIRAGAAVTAVFVFAISAAGCAGQDASGMVVSSDPALQALAAELLPDLARRSGMELREPVRVEQRTRAELVRYLEHKLDEELPEEEERAIVDVYSLLGLVPADFDLRQVLMGLYTEQVAGFYEPDSTALFVMDDQNEADLRGLLVHELVHAVQDQSVDLDALTDPERGADRATAAQSAIEGHATLVMFEFIAEEQMGSPVDLSRVPGFGPMLRQNLGSVRSQFPALATAPAILQESLIFPYLEGAVYLQGLWAKGRRVVPFGEELPLSTEEILDPSAGPPFELELAVAGGEVVRDNQLGRLELSVLMRERVGERAAGIAEGWDGDRYALVERTDGERALFSFIVWEDAGVRDRFVGEFASELAAFGAPAAVEATDVDGRPASLLTIGDASGITVRASAAGGR